MNIEKIENAAITMSAKAAVKATTTLGKLMSRKTGKLLVTLPLAVSMMTITVFAEDTTAEGTIKAIVTLLQTWIPRLGAMLVAVGGIQFAMGFKDDDQTGKTRGMQCMVGGAIVAAVGKVITF